jgi:two-component system chemotaxis response regulator CheB
MKKNGAYTIGQDEESCVVYGMPKVAFNIGAVEEQKNITEIPSIIIEHLSQFKRSKK